MRIGIYSVDGGSFPNIALMKIAAYHRDLGYEVEWALPLAEYDVVYESKLFTFTPKPSWRWLADRVVRGGTGYDAKSRLDESIEKITQVDWSIYPQCNFSVVFLSRGCIRKCPFCVVPVKEGLIKAENPISLNPRGEFIHVLDNNFFANPQLDEAVRWIDRTGQRVELHGVDIRMMRQRHFEILAHLPLHRYLRFAWDNPQDDLSAQVDMLLKYIKPWRIVCYVLVGFNSSLEDDLRRIIWLEERGITPFVMIYRDFENQVRQPPILQHLARWCNRREIFKSCTFSEYISEKIYPNR